MHERFELNGRRGGIVSDLRGDEVLLALLSTGPSGGPLHDGRNQVHHVQSPDLSFDIAWKCFGREPGWKNKVDQERGSKAERSFRTACHLVQHGVGTPAPVAWLDRWEGDRLAESWYLSRFEPGLTSFKDELVRLWEVRPPLCRHFMDLFELIAAEVRKLHEAGVVHRDLGNQNILLRQLGDAVWEEVQFIDLNRARIHHPDPLTMEQRGKDLSRIALPSDLRRVFFEMVFSPGVVPETFTVAERAARRAFDIHTATRPLRHPIRTRRRPPVPSGYPEERGMYLWDDRSVQAIPVLRGRDRRKHRPLRGVCRTMASVLKRAPMQWLRHRRLMREAFQRPVDMSGRIGLADEAAQPPPPEFAELDRPPLLLRFYHHDPELVWRSGIEQARQLRAEGHSISIALVQCRDSLEDIDSWTYFAGTVLGSLADDIEFAEVGHAINRVKWGLWTVADYRRLIEPLRGIPVPLTGPAVIDWEPHQLAAALDTIPAKMRFHALSHHLYVDRRGAPENEQNGHDLVSKLAWLKGVARGAGAFEERVIVSEVNWPLLGTGPWSPVNSPYDSPGPRENDPSVDEESYANHMVRYLLLALCSGFADRVYWWKLAAQGFGLIDDPEDGPRRRRPAYDAFRRLLETLGQARFMAREPSEDESVIQLRFKDPVCTVAWTTGEAPVALPGPRESLDGPVTELGSAPVYLMD